MPKSRSQPKKTDHSTTPLFKTITVNRRARFDYEVLESVEAGLVLTGTEIKAIREGRINIREAFARPDQMELWLYNCHIAPYSGGNLNNHEPIRPRKLLLHKEQIASLSSKVGEKGYTLIPLRLYLKSHRAKIELGLCRGRRNYDKRQVIAEREDKREMERAGKMRLLGK